MKKKKTKRQKYPKLFKTERAWENFKEEYADVIDLREAIFKRYPVHSWKDLADKVFSQYIRLKGANRSGVCVCITCWKRFFWKKIQNGHYRSRWDNKYRFDETNCHPQCERCNIHLSWNYRNYHKYMVDRYWEEVEEKIRNDKESVKYKQQRYEEHILEWFAYIEKKESIIEKRGEK